MNTWVFEDLYRDGHWQGPCRVSVDAQGCIQSLSPADSADIDTPGWVIPGFINGHSHSFQYAFAGQAETLGSTQADNFWRWREYMYQCVLTLTPEDLYTITLQLYQELLRHGFTHVVEFHYCHHDPAGKPYTNRALLAEQIMQAATTAGIALTLIPIFYQQNQFTEAPLPEQRRFICRDLADYQTLVAAIQSSAKHYDRVQVGVGFHSLRAVHPDILPAFFREMAAIPIHGHIAETQQEVTACQQRLGTTPVDWLLAHCDIGDFCNLVHATHISTDECRAMVEASVNVVLCPSTEANLGDGFFPLQAYHQAGGQWCIGTDSHIGIAPLEELRWLEYGQRLLHQRRNILCDSAAAQSGDLLYHAAGRGGLTAIGQAQQSDFALGSYFDAVILNANAPRLKGQPPENRLSCAIFTGSPELIRATITAGQWRYSSV